MNLYTVTVIFEDRTKAIEQVESQDETEALHKALREAEALKNHEKNAIEETINGFLVITHLAMDYKGVWTWHHYNFENEKVDDIYGA